jgi:hypothetical protein
VRARGVPACACRPCDNLRRVRRDLRTRLIVPAALAVSSFGPGCGDDKQPTTTSDTTPQTETSAATEVSTADASTTSTTEPETTRPTTGDDTSGSSTGTGGDTTSETGGELPDCSVFDGEMAACQAMVGCAWDYEQLTCGIDCTVIHDEATCNKAMICFWADTVCYPPI